MTEHFFAAEQEPFPRSRNDGQAGQTFVLTSQSLSVSLAKQEKTVVTLFSLVVSLENIPAVSQFP